MVTKQISESVVVSKRTRTILISVAQGVTTGGVILQLQDDDDEGTDDEIGMALQITGDVFRRVAAGRIKGRDGILRAIADGIYMQLGVDVPE